MHRMSEVFHAKVYEPVKRRKGSPYPQWIGHRFPIKGGLSLRETMIRDMSSQTNPLWNIIMHGKRYASP